MTEPRSGWLDGMFGYWRPNGQFMPAIAGAQDTDTETDEGTDEEGTDEESDDEEEGDDENLDDIKDPTKKLKAETEKKNRFKRQLDKAQKELEAAKAAIQEQEDAKKSDNEKLQERANKAESQVKELETKLENQHKRFLLSEHEELSKLSPERRKTILKLIDMDEIEIDEDGDSNVDDVVAGLKKESAFLFSVDGEDSDSDESSDEEDTPRRRTAPPPKKKKDKNAQDRMGLEKRLPHLAKHRA